MVQADSLHLEIGHLPKPQQLSFYEFGVRPSFKSIHCEGQSSIRGGAINRRETSCFWRTDETGSAGLTVRKDFAGLLIHLSVG